ncbi:MAG: AAA family ATPase [Solirubrobacteraceae bacterium]
MAELLVAATTAALDARDLQRALERALPEGVGVRRAPGLLVAEGDGGSALDAARRRAATVLVLAPAGPDLLNHALLTAEAARAAGLPVAAVIVAGHGAAEQRAALRERAGCAVVDLGDLQAPSATVAQWPLADWIAAEPTGAGGTVALAPYGGWEPRQAPDPRDAGRHKVDPMLLEIITAEGPVLADRAYGLFNRAAGGHKLTAVARAPLSGSAYRLKGDGKIVFDEVDGDAVLRAAGTPRVRVRELGGRGLDEVPLSEIAELMRRLRAAGATDLPRATLDAYGLVRMTTRAQDILARAQALAEEPQ